MIFSLNANNFNYLLKFVLGSRPDLGPGHGPELCLVLGVVPSQGPALGPGPRPEQV